MHLRSLIRIFTGHTFFLNSRIQFLYADNKTSDQTAWMRRLADLSLRWAHESKVTFTHIAANNNNNNNNNDNDNNN